MWTDNRVDACRRGEVQPSVAVWTARQLAAVFDFAREDRLFAMWWLIAVRGLRRGEAAGLRWIDIDLAQRVVMIEQQRIARRNPQRRSNRRDQNRYVQSDPARASAPARAAHP